MRVWVTGASGLLGSAVVQSLQAKGIAFAGSTRQQADTANLASMAQFCNQYGPFTHIINCAGYTKVDLAETQPEEARRANALSPALLGLLAADQSMRVVHFSTDYVFDGKGNRPYVESDPIAPESVYGKTKAEGEMRLLSVLPSACILRTSWLFGAGGRNFVSSMLDLMKQREELKVVFDQKGRPTYAPDLAEAAIQALNWSGIYHFANSEETNWHAFAGAIRAMAEESKMPLVCRNISPITSAEFAAAAKRPLYSVLDTKKFEQRLGAPIRPWRDGLRDLLLGACASSK